MNGPQLLDLTALILFLRAGFFLVFALGPGLGGFFSSAIGAAYLLVFLLAPVVCGWGLRGRKLWAYRGAIVIFGLGLLAFVFTTPLLGHFLTDLVPGGRWLAVLFGPNVIGAVFDAVFLYLLVRPDTRASARRRFLW